MDLALYHPEFGYYRKFKDPFGIKGDFYTAEQLEPFGDMITSFLAKTFPEAAAPRPAVLEIGAGRQDLRFALAKWNYQGFDWDANSLPAHWKGLVLANEFFDALPVQVYRRCAHGWRERRIGFAGDRFHWLEIDPVDTAPDEYLARYEEHVPESGVIEVSLDLSTWMQRIARLLTAGVLLVVDYGYDAKELSRFPEGTLMAYRKHAADPDVLASPGDRDITAHVNWTELLRSALGAGLGLRYNGTMRSWALSLWTPEELKERWCRSGLRWQMQWKQLVIGMGDTFRVAVFDKPSAKQNAPENRRRQ